MLSPLRSLAAAVAILACACASTNDAWVELAALKAERLTLDAATAGAFQEAHAAALGASTTLGEYKARMISWHELTDRIMVLVHAIDQSAHNAAVKLANGDARVRSRLRGLVCILGETVRAAGVNVLTPGRFAQRCAQ